MTVAYRSLQELAAEIAAEMEQARPSLQAKLLKIQAQLREMEEEKRSIETELHATNLARHRLANYRPQLGGQDQCPGCWVRNEVASSLAAIGASYVEDNPLGNDAFKCRHCDLTVLLAR